MNKRKRTKVIVFGGSGFIGSHIADVLTDRGYAVTVFDSFPKPGGMMRYGIPNYRLPEERLDKDINEILEWGVTFKGDTTIGKDITLDGLKKDFDAIFMASGANGSIKIPLKGAEKEGVLWGWDFLRDVGLGKAFDLKGDVSVVGGGNVAIDVALTAKRMGAKDVHLFCLEKREEMPAHEWEIDRATSIATLPPPTTITSPLKSHPFPRPISRRNSQPQRTPSFSTPAKGIVRLPLAPVAKKIASKSSLSLSRVISSPMVVFPLNVTPNSRISLISLSSLSSGNR